MTERIITQYARDVWMQNYGNEASLALLEQIFTSAVLAPSDVRNVLERPYHIRGASVVVMVSDGLPGIALLAHKSRKGRRLLLMNMFDIAGVLATIERERQDVPREGHYSNYERELRRAFRGTKKRRNDHARRAVRLVPD
jgi:hypothetical protein